MSRPKTWRNGITIHPLAAKFKMMSDDELEELGADMKENGQREPVLFAEIKGKKTLIDGRNRMAAGFLVGMTVAEIMAAPELAGNPKELKAHILSKNVHRRHLSRADRADALRGFVKANPEKSDRAIAKKVGVSHPTVAKARKEVESTGNDLPVEPRTGIDGRKRKQPTPKPQKAVDVVPEEAPAAALGAGNGFSATGSTTATVDESVEQRKAQAGEGNTAAVDEFKECCARLIPTMDTVDLAEVRRSFDQECGKRVVALRVAS
jgi:ParB-like chromosome segregation protein Spo0J